MHHYGTMPTQSMEILPTSSLVSIQPFWKGSTSSQGSTKTEHDYWYGQKYSHHRPNPEGEPMQLTSSTNTEKVIDSAFHLLKTSRVHVAQAAATIG